ncbi:MAG: MgtC/SapB family protein [Mesorhizobium sp.]
MYMPLNPSVEDLALRLVLTVMASALIGLNREARGHAAGFRTTILVGLAACLTMIQANLLLSLEGKTPESFAVADVLRFPLGVLTGVGFIGGGTILKRGSLMLGVTTAATLWLVTAIGLCFGGGQWAVGTAGTFLAVFTLWALKWLDMRIPREHRALLAIDAAGDWAPVPNELDRILRPKGYRAQFVGHGRPQEGVHRLKFEISWKQPDLAGYPLVLAEAVEDKWEIASMEMITEGNH